VMDRWIVNMDLINNLYFGTWPMQKKCTYNWPPPNRLLHRCWNRQSLPYGKNYLEILRAWINISIRFGKIITFDAVFCV
jgi:hypothetical protein